jgi:DtxR family Mn-dependent transcriptional regulator
MLKKLEKEGYLKYIPRKGVKLTSIGRKIAQKIIRNHRLTEVMMDKVLNIEIDHKSVCGIEHHMDKKFSEALCILLKHPRKCPHGEPIPKGDCCTSSEGD